MTPASGSHLPASGSYVVDARGERWLDAGFSHALVGHGNPHVAEAVARAMGSSETADRLREEYSARLLERFPTFYSKVSLLHSTSEACELALRLARAHRPGKDAIVLEDADYGMTTSLANMSPGQFAARGGGRKFWVHVAGRNAASVGERARGIGTSGRGLSGFFAEGVFEDGFLREAYAHVHAAGGLNIAVERQTGMGRVGTAFWEFARHNVEPDIVVVGESMANGLPLAAVVTSRELAAPFDPFESWGEGAGAVECSAALAVLDVWREPAMDLELPGVGVKMLGAGLCWEIEVPDAAAVVARLREHRILIRARGNALLFRPPLTFSMAEASEFQEGLLACV